MSSLFQRALGERFAALPPAVAAVHGAEAGLVLTGRGRARGARTPWVRLARRIAGLPEPGRYPKLRVVIAADARGESWTRDFGARRFTSRLTPAGPGRFEERFGPLRFRFGIDLTRRGFGWRFEGWKLGPLPMPRFLAPRIRARAFEADGQYRFRVATAHPLAGLVFAYAGRLDIEP